MGDQEIRIERVHVKELYEFACAVRERSGPDDVCPIPKHLALAQTTNPYADPEDLALVVAWIDGRCAGYCGAIPGLLKAGHQYSKVLWFTSFYVDASYRGQGIGKLLLRSVLDTPEDIVGAWISDAAKHACKSVGILGGIGPRRVGVLEPRMFEFKVNRLIGALSRRAPSDRPPSLMVRKLQDSNSRYLYPLLRKLFYFVLRVSSRRAPTNITFEEADRIPDDALVGESKRQTPVFHRGVEWINWRLQDPWVLTYEDTDERYDNYYFRAVQPFFKIMALNLYGKGRNDYRGFVVVSISMAEQGTTLKLLEHHFEQDADAACVLDIVATLGSRYGADRVYIPDQLARWFEQNVVARRFFQFTIHDYLLRALAPDSALGSRIDEIELDLCDGDFSFT